MRFLGCFWGFRRQDFFGDVPKTANAVGAEEAKTNAMYEMFSQGTQRALAGSSAVLFLGGWQRGGTRGHTSPQAKVRQAMGS
jgi:hypothetical protein